MRLVVGLKPVRLRLLRGTGEGKQSFKMTVILIWMPWHPRFISVCLSRAICHPVCRASSYILPQIELISSTKVSFSFSPALQCYYQSPVLLLWYSGSPTATAPCSSPLNPRELFTFLNTLIYPSQLFSTRCLRKKQSCSTTGKTKHTKPAEGCCCLLKRTFTDYFIDLVVCKWEICK